MVFATVNGQQTNQADAALLEAYITARGNEEGLRRREDGLLPRDGLHLVGGGK